MSKTPHPGVPQAHPTGTFAVLQLMDHELQVLISYYELEANKWGINNGVMESPPMYEFSVHRLRGIEEMQDRLRTVRETMVEAAAENGVDLSNPADAAA